MNPVDSPKNDPGRRYFHRLTLALATLAFLSCLGLDFLAARRGERAYLFPRRTGRQAETPAPVSLSDLAGRLFTESGLAEGTVLADRDENGQPRYSIELAPEAYSSLASALRSLFRDNDAAAEVEEGESEGKTTYSWRIRRGASEKLSILFSCLPASAPKVGELPPPVPPAPSDRPAARSPEKLAAIIIDDMGSSLETLQEIIDLGLPLTVSVLPESPYAQETAQAAHDRGLEVMLHLPGESLNHLEGESPFSRVVRADMSPEEIRALVVDSLGRVPYASGVNNHMGSRLTRERAAMMPLLDVVKERGLFFVDSLTGSRSIAYDLARRMGLRSTYRNVFLDSEIGVDYSRRKLVELFELAKKKGRALAIGHPFPETIQALREGLSLMSKYGVQLVPASRVIPD